MVLEESDYYLQVFRSEPFIAIVRSKASAAASRLTTARAVADCCSYSSFIAGSIKEPNSCFD